jgi:hypothetical protein
LFSMLAARYPLDPLVNLYHHRLERGEYGNRILMAEK